MRLSGTCHPVSAVPPRLADDTSAALEPLPVRRSANFTAPSAQLPPPELGANRLRGVVL